MTKFNKPGEGKVTRTKDGKLRYHSHFKVDAPQEMTGPNRGGPGYNRLQRDPKAYEEMRLRTLKLQQEAVEGVRPQTTAIGTERADGYPLPKGRK